MTAIHPCDSIEHFALLCAMRDLRSEIKSEDLRAWSAARKVWLPILAAGVQSDLAVRFARAYAVAHVEDGQSPSADMTTAEVPPPNGAEPDRTIELPVNPASAAPLPFKSSQARAGIDTVDATLEVPMSALRPLPVMPFAAPNPSTRRQRMLRFDTQTGQPLASPIWVDEPEAPNER